MSGESGRYDASLLSGLKSGSTTGGPPTGRQSHRGNAASPGVGIGLAYVLDRRKVQVPHRHIDKAEVDAEQKRFRVALKGTQEQLEAIKTRLSHGEHRLILKAQQMMLRDPDLIHQTETLIREELLNAEWAVARATDSVRDTLEKVGDDYLRERAGDVAFIAERLLSNLAGGHPEELNPPEGAVIVAHDLSPADTAQLHHRKVAGIVTSEGGRTSHTAIMARALEIPAVVGIDGIIDAVETGDRVVVDGTHGGVIVRPTPDDLSAFESESERYQAFQKKVNKQRALLAITDDGTHVMLRANVALAEDLDSAVSHGAEGVGLYRTEYMFMGRDAPPTEEEHYRAAKDVLARCAPYPVTMRTFDLGSDKQCRFFVPGEPEANPAMGLRSLRLALREREAFLTQLRGLLRAGLHGPLRIMLPLVSGLGELRLALEAVEEARQQLDEEGMAFDPDVPVGIMIELPSAAMVADLLARHVDFMSIGTNDLIQYTLAIDRENDEVNYLYEPMHPAILRLIQRVTMAGANAGIPVSLCGEMAADPLFTWVLCGLGLRELSMHPGAIPVVKSVLRGSSIDDMEGLAETLVGIETAQEAEREVKRVMLERFPEHMRHGTVVLDDET